MIGKPTHEVDQRICSILAVNSFNGIPCSPPTERKLPLNSGGASVTVSLGTRLAAWLTAIFSPVVEFGQHRKDPLQKVGELKRNHRRG